MNNNDKLALREGTAAIKCKLIVKATNGLQEMILTESNCVKDWVYTDERYVPQQGFIGQFVARTLSGNLQNIDDDFNIENREVELQIGVVNRDNNTENWYSMGNFLITNPEDDEVRDNTKFEAMDYAKLFNKTFDGDYTDDIFTVSYNTKMENKETVTALWLAKYTCAQVNVELGSDAFTNDDYQIDINPFRNNEPCRDVMKEISKLAYSWVRIGWDNKCYIDFTVKSQSSVSEYDVFTNNHYYTLDTKKETYGPINKVVVGMSNVDGESHATTDTTSINNNGEHTIYIYDNPLTYTFEHRERANEKGNVLFGLSYSHINCETIGFPWLIGNELISISNMEGNEKYTYPFNKTITYNGHIKSTIDSMGESAIEETLSYESDVVRNARNAFINVNKQEGSIHILSEKIEVVEKEINPTKDESGSEIIVEDASNNPLINLEIEGKSTQATRSGKNLWNNKEFYTNSANVERTETGFIFTRGSETGSKYFAFKVSAKAGETFTFSANGASYNNGSSLFMYKEQVWGTNIKSGYNSITGTTDADGNIAFTIFADSNTQSLTISEIQVEKSSSKTKYEKYGVSPSPDHPSEIKSIGYHNEFDSERWYEILRAAREQSMMKETVNGIEYYKFLPHTIYNVEWNAGEFKENTQYTLSFKGLKYIASNPTATGFSFNYTDGTWDYVAISSETEQEYYLTSTPGKTIKYIGLYYSQGYYALVRDIQVVEGTAVHDYIPYDKYGVKIKTTGKNVLDIDNSAIAYLTKNSDGSFTSNINNGYYASISCTAELRELFINSLGKTFTFSVENNYGYYISIVIIGTRSNGSVYQEANNVGNSVTITIADDFTSISDIQLRPLRDTSPYTNTTNVIRNLQLEENNVATEYNKFEGNELLAVLSQPLRSLPNKVKDILYIKNDKLYVDRYITNAILNGTERWLFYASGNADGYVYYVTSLTDSAIGYEKSLCSHFKNRKYAWDEGVVGQYSDHPTLVYKYFVSDKETVSEFTNWLSSNNIELVYEIATPITEEIGEIKMLKTLKGYNKISTTDNLLPIINLTYVRDTILADYVENHVAELKITEGEIKESVEKVSTSVDGLNSTVNRVEEITTSNSQVINVISTSSSFDLTTGEVREVTTTTGFTFNQDGMTITDGSGFKAEHRADGTYYKDGTSTVGQYTKDGSKQKDLSLFGTYSYAMNDKDATPMFVGQLFTNANGEEGFGHFYNGGDY